MLEVLAKRRSVRRFTEEKVSPDALKQILQAGLLAPTGKGKKHVEFIVVEDVSRIRELADVKEHGTSPLKTAMLAIIVLGDRQLTDTWIEDASLATIFMQLQVTALGLGSTWVQVDKRKNTQGQVSADFLQERYDFPMHLHPLCVLAIGHKAEDPKAYEIGACDFSKVHYEKY